MLKVGVEGVEVGGRHLCVDATRHLSGFDYHDISTMNVHNEIQHLKSGEINLGVFIRFTLLQQALTFVARPQSWPSSSRTASLLAPTVERRLGATLYDYGLEPCYHLITGNIRRIV